MLAKNYSFDREER